ncbi:hypothetical protein [Haloarcula sebkhae]|uniref:Uncharacterized protein n=2 Tax=Haloarcula sebkhae TaxID=932660 RepID=A0ACC6VJL5_9EURY|nr:hypothetical protein [Haloarcula sebkhae]GGK74481.1 hypothetical protein GCM10009067_28340 [Haloarcula sebkhae]
MTFNIRDDNGTLIGKLDADTNGDIIVEHSQSGEQARLTGDGLDVSAVSAGEVSDGVTGTMIQAKHKTGDNQAYIKSQPNLGVDASTASTIYKERDGFVVVSGDSEYDGTSRRFNDVVLFDRNAGATVINSVEAFSPDSRSYSTSSDGLDLQFDTSSYTPYSVTVMALTGEAH